MKCLAMMGDRHLKRQTQLLQQSTKHSCDTLPSPQLRERARAKRGRVKAVTCAKDHPSACGPLLATISTPSNCSQRALSFHATPTTDPP
eukprot:CAMPEP_0206240096 /NCGR_PEP_ID=MMETSP0047_2-20121206/15751_1 /ASSEMBLY_ACC=CAM_ASM_000192 /TAXON_ID=195065 /ORGANISM="Chroomonas mesostigmatica_cf, Strain CCMP1168" /LENGTH=88 /DNA_ID=CAMNT_0053664845 /DNA_START=215 /DNA_END=478 /DNA_ORIENTATION=+